MPKARASQKLPAIATLPRLTSARAREVEAALLDAFSPAKGFRMDRHAGKGMVAWAVAGPGGQILTFALAARGGAFLARDERSERQLGVEIHAKTAQDDVLGAVRALLQP